MIAKYAAAATGENAHLPARAILYETDDDEQQFSSALVVVVICSISRNE